MSYTEISGNIFNSEAEALINTVNCVGVMGKGIALEFRRRFPIMFETYLRECERGEYSPGQIKFYSERGKTIVNCAIKDHWRNPSKIEWLDSCLEAFCSDYKERHIRSAAFPWMGAQNGRLPFNLIQSKMQQHLSGLFNIEIEVYDFDPSASDPLFEKLVAIANSKSYEEYQSMIGLRNDIFHNMIRQIQTGNITSLNMLSSQKVIGETSTDKLYSFLIDFNPESTPPNQLNFLNRI